DVVSPIIDYYFPETKNKIKSNLYYDFQSVIAPIKDRSVKEVSLEPLNPIEPLHGKYIIADNFDHINHLTSEINPYARRLRINGNIKELPDNKWRIVMGSQNKQNLNAFLNYLK